MSRTTRTSLVLLPLLALPLASPARASQYLKLTAPAPNSTLPPLAQTVTFSYVIDANGFHRDTQSKILGTWITVCTGACADAGDIIDSHKLTASEQSTTSLGHLEAAGGAVLQAKPVASPTPAPAKKP